VFSLFSLSIPRANRFAQAKDLQALLKEKGLATSGELTSFAEPLLVVCCKKLPSADFPLLGKKAELIQRLLDASESGFIPWQSSYPFLLSPFFGGCSQADRHNASGEPRLRASMTLSWAILLFLDMGAPVKGQYDRVDSCPDFALG
jgi:hypothetical protein